MDLPKKRANLDAGSARDRLDFFDLANDLERHTRIVVENLEFGKSSDLPLSRETRGNGASKVP